MGYTAWSVVFGEQPTAAKWNQLGENDAGFKDGTNIDDGAIIGSHLSTSAILLGSATRTSNFSHNTSSATQVTSLTSTVTVPAGGRSVMIVAGGYGMENSTVDEYSEISIWDGTVGSGTQLAANIARSAVASGTHNAFVMAFQTPSAGSKTYNVGLRNAGAGTASLFASATAPSYIKVLLI